MKTKYSLKNFRVFDNNGAVINISPITLLTGCNSSGKSSIVKSMVLLRDYIEIARKDLIVNNRLNPSVYSIDFSTAGVNLCNFDSVVNRHSGSNEFVLSYTTAPINFPYKVDLHFSSRENDFFNNAWISQIDVFDADNILILSAQNNGNVMKLIHLNYSDYFVYEFNLVAYAVTYNYLCQQRNMHCDEQGNILDDAQYEYWEGKVRHLIQRIDELYDGPYFKSLFVSTFNKLRTAHNGEEFFAIAKDLSEPLSHLYKDSLMFYFPVFELMKGKTKEEVCDMILHAETVDFLFDSESMKKDSMAIAEDFLTSNFDNFIEYFLSHENDKLKSITAMSSDFTAQNIKGDFIDSICATAHIRYTPHDKNVCIFDESDPDAVDFARLYRFLTRWQWKEGMPSEIFSTYVYEDESDSSHELYNTSLSYLGVLLKSILVPDIFYRLKYVGNFQSDVRRIYLFDGSENKLGLTIKSFLNLKAELLRLNHSKRWVFEMSKEKVYKPGQFVNKWIKKLNIGNSLNIIEDEDGLGAKLFIRKDASRRGYPLADEGYGISQLVTFLLNIEVEIIANKIAEANIKVRESRIFKPQVSVSTIMLEEPEVSLHPSMQSQLADIFLDAYENYGIHFIVETHSEYLIRRTQAFVANYKTPEQFDEKPFTVIYVGNKGNAYELEYTETGRFNRSFGPGFFDEASRSCMEILKRERRNTNGKNA